VWQKKQIYGWVWSSGSARGLIETSATQVAVRYPIEGEDLLYQAKWPLYSRRARIQPACNFKQ